jgi:peptide/nickel transport system substrate-binding protein
MNQWKRGSIVSWHRLISRRNFLSRGAVTGGAILIGTGAGGALAGCSSGSSGSGGSGGTGGSGAASNSKAGIGSGTPRRGGTAIIGSTADIDGFLPSANHWDNNGFNYANAIYDPLAAVGADGTIKPYLAQSFTPNADYTTWTIRLRPGVLFHDGSALTASVVKANVDALKTSALTKTALEQVTSVAVSDPMTVVFKLLGPNAAFPASLTTQVGYVVGQAMLDQAANGVAAPKPIGTGPFVYGEWQPNDHFTANRNPHYWRNGYPYLDQITFKPIPDTTQREATLKSKGVDMILSIDPNTVDRFRNQSGYQVVDSLSDTRDEPDIDFIMLNCAKAPTDDLRVRQALAKGLDQVQLQKIFGGGLAKPVNGLFPKGSKYYSDTGYPSFDPKGAKALVAAYKKDHGTPTFELGAIADPRVLNAAQTVQSMWQAVGFKVNIKAITQADLISSAISGGYQAVTFELFAAVDPDINYVWWSTTTIAGANPIGLNFAKNNDPQIETALIAGRSSPDPAARIAAYQKVNERLAQDLPYIWLGQTVWSEVGDSRIQNFANPILPDGSPGTPFDNGVFSPTQIWMAG